MKQIFLTLILLMISFSSIGQLPAVTVKDIDGKSIKTDTLSNNGKPYVICFFALWCKPCLRELNAISEVYEDWQKETGMKIFAVSIDDGQNADRVAPLVNGYGWNYDVLLDVNKDFMRSMNVSLIPCLFIMDEKNNIVKRKTSYTDGSEEMIIDEIRKLLKKN